MNPTTALRKLLTDDKCRENFQQKFNHSVEEYISSLIDPEDADDIVKSVDIMSRENNEES